jgi:hypothetical protein
MQALLSQRVAPALPSASSLSRLILLAVVLQMLFAVVPAQSLVWGETHCTPGTGTQTYVSPTYGTFDGCNGWNVVDTYSCNSPPCGTANGFGFPAQPP